MPQVPTEVLRCVAFLSPQKNADPDATVFFVRIHANDPRSDGPVAAVYAVTAKHTLKKYVEEAASSEAWLRLNKRTGGVERIATQISDWRLHDEADIAIYLWSQSRDYDIEPFPIRQHLIDDIIEQWGVGPGDEVFLSGLFWQHVGFSKNAPIVRTGNIAAMRGDKIYTTNYGAMDTYLIEVRSVGGLSGSPVFFNGSGIRDMSVPAVSIGGRALQGRIERRVIAKGFFLMGLVHGHYYERASRTDVFEDVINSGVAIVVPAEKILELILHPDEVARRNRRGV